MTIFGPDISSYQQGLDLSKLTSASFIIAKCTEGTYYTDADYQGWRQQAAQLGKPFIWYAFLSGEGPHSQAAHAAANVGDRSLPGMLDVEPTSTFRPTLAQALAWLDAAAAAGLHVPLVYLPHWYWVQLGSPDLSGIAARGAHLVSSAYPGGTGSPAGLYPGDGAPGWNAYGGLTPLLYQYTDKASDGGQALDYNAFRGSLTELAANLNGEVTMALTQADVFSIWGFKNPQAGDVSEDMRQRLVNAEAAAQAANAKLDQVLAAIGHLPAPTIDPAALAAAIAPLLNQGATPDAIAQAVISHLSVTVTAK